MGIQIKYGTIEFPGMEGFKVGLYTPFSEFDYSEYHWGNEDGKKIYWYKTEG